MECFCDYEEPVVYDRQEVKARTAHKCTECGRVIAAGEVYERVGSLFDGRWETYKTCSHCMALRQWVKAHVPCLCWCHHNMIEDVMETAKGYSHEAPWLLFGAYRRQIAIRRARQTPMRNAA